MGEQTKGIPVGTSLMGINEAAPVAGRSEIEIKSMSMEDLAEGAVFAGRPAPGRSHRRFAVSSRHG